MQEETFRSPTSVDSRTAEQALALAIRLQQENGERVPLEQLQRTADEAGIDRVYLEQALFQVSHPTVNHTETESEVDTRKRKRIVIMAVGFGIAAFVSAMVQLAGTSDGDGGLLPLVIFAVIGLVFAKRIRGGRSGRKSFFE